MWEIFKSLYSKQKIDISLIEEWMVTTLNKWIAKDKYRIQYLKPLLKYTYYISVESYYYLLFFNLPSGKLPYIGRKQVKEEKINPLQDKLQYLLGWSNKDMRLHQSILDRQILSNETVWKEKLGVK